MHKRFDIVVGCPEFPIFRPIIPLLGTFNYPFSSHLGDMLKDIIPKDNSCLDTFAFIEDLKGCDIKDKFTISFDICLFSSIPLHETLNLAVELIFENNPQMKISQNELMELFRFCISKTNFLFNGAVYDQIDGIARGSPLAPTLANLFMGHHEKIRLNQYEGVGPSFYRRYVDNIFAVFENKEDYSSFLEYLILYIKISRSPKSLMLMVNYCFLAC